jgi:hypothetical protein
MRRVIRTLACTLVLGGFVLALAPAGPAASRPGPPAAIPAHGSDFSSTEAVLKWINAYRTKPDIAQVPAAVRALSALGAFRDTENSSVYVGFVAGAIRTHPQMADELVEKMLPIKAEDHWFIVRTVAYSGIPGWREVLKRYASRMPTRQLMIEKLTTGKLPTLDAISFDKSPTAFDKLTGWTEPVGEFFTGKKPKPVRMDVTPEVLDALWGYYFATAGYEPVERILLMLPWSKERDSVDKLTVGSMAKFTLASNASHDPDLLAMLRREQPRQPKEVQPILNEVIEAVDTMEITRLRKEALAAIDDLKRKGPGSKRDLGTWGQIGQGAVALGCVAAAATGQVEIGIPCVVGGALGTAAFNYWNRD